MTRDLSIVIPAFQEELRLPRTLAALHHFVAAGASDIEVLLVDDGSEDATVDIMNAWCAERPFARSFALLHAGKAHAVKTGVMAARRYRVIFMDADLAVPLDEVPKLLRQLDRGADVAVGSREARGSSRVGEPPLRRLRGRAFNLLVQSLLVKGVSDTQCGFKAFTRKAARQIFTRTLLHAAPGPGLKGPSVTAFDVEVLFLAEYLGLKVAEVPVQWTHVRDSKVRALADPLRMTGDVLRIRLNAMTGKYSRLE